MLKMQSIVGEKLVGHMKYAVDLKGMPRHIDFQDAQIKIVY